MPKKKDTVLFTITAVEEIENMVCKTDACFQIEKTYRRSMAGAKGFDANNLHACLLVKASTLVHRQA